jgi:hypothetical protein
MDRRSSTRRRVDILLNKHLDGFPYACRVLDISSGGMLLRRIHEPDVEHESCTLELGLPGSEQSLWIWARPVWTKGRRQAMRFLGVDPRDKAVLDEFLEAQDRAA